MTAGFLGASGTAQARPRVYVIPSQGAFATREHGAVGLYVPGAGGTVSRAGAIAAIRRGQVENAALGETPHGQILVDVVFGVPGPQIKKAVLVELPPPGKHPNTKRYGVIIFGAGYQGILTSHSTRIRGLVSIADLAPTAVALQAGRAPPIRADLDRDAPDDLRALDTRLTRVHHDRGWVFLTVVLTIIAMTLFAPRAAALGGAAAFTVSLLLSWAGVTRLGAAIAAIATLTIVLAVAGSFRRSIVPPVIAAFLVVLTIVLAVDPELNSLAVLGARPDGGGRFYGIGNQVETLLLAPVLLAAAIGGLRWLVPLAALALVAIGWSKTGADGGGVVVFATALGVLAFRLRGLAVTPRRLALVAVTVLVVALAFVGLDAALGGSSHVTRAVGSGPDSLVGGLGHRLHLSWAAVTDRWIHGVVFLVLLAALVLMGTIRPRRATVDALLVGLAVSLVVNDTPVDVIGLGALGCWALLRWESVDSRPMRRGALIAAAAAVAVLVLAGCGKQGITRPLPITVVGTVKAVAPGKAIFVSQGCGACHTYKPAGPAANGKIGPDLDKLAQYAKQAHQPLATFVHDSIVDPNKYIQKGYPRGVMPHSYKSLPKTDLTALVDFLTKPQG
ncbi:MAG TPA: c-type cytochrome [Gaiellaceae bacterium]|jgi:cytochrome c551/c552